MEIALRVPGCAPANESAAFARRVEEAGFDGMGIPDTQLIMRDVYVTMALAAQNTSNLKLYTAVTNPVTRHFSVLASLVQTVEEIAPGRIGIIIGSGYSAVRTIGQRRSTLDMMRQCVLTVRKLLNGEEVNFDGFNAQNCLSPPDVASLSSLRPAAPRPLNWRVKWRTESWFR